MALLTKKMATSRTPQVVTLVVDDSQSMQEPCAPGKSKATVATESIENMVMATQSGSQGSKGSRFFVNIAKFGDGVTPIAEAQPPGEVDLRQLKFQGESGWTNMADAVEWAAASLEKALSVCRGLPGYDETKCPPPLVVFLSDGENTGGPVDAAAQKLRSIRFQGDSIAIIACGIGMKPEHFEVMRTIASKSEFAVNINPARLAEFLAGVGTTVIKGTPNEGIVQPFVDDWDATIVKGQQAVERNDTPTAEAALMDALKQVRNTPDHRLLSTLTDLTQLHVDKGEWTKALPFCNEALGVLEKLGTSTVLQRCTQAAEGLAELLQIAGDTGEAIGLWIKIASLWERPEAANWVERSGKWSAFGFRDLARGRNAEAEAAFHKAVHVGGPGAAAAEKALATINEPRGAGVVQPYLEKLVDRLDQRFGSSYILTVKAVSELRMSYVIQGKTEMAAALNRRFPRPSNL